MLHNRQIKRRGKGGLSGQWIAKPVEAAMQLTTIRAAVCPATITKVTRLCAGAITRAMG